MRRFPCGFAVIILPLLLAGCGMPAPVQIASLIADGFSLFATEKTITDHGISMVAEKDCAVWRGVKGQDICLDGADDPYQGTTALAGVPGGQAAYQSAAVETVEREPLTAPVEAQDGDLSGEEEGFAADEISAQPADEAIRTAPAPLQMTPQAPQRDKPRDMVKDIDVEDKGGLHFVLASFARPDNAKRLVLGNRHLSPVVVTARVRDRTMHRVVVGPFRPEERKTLRSRLAEAGFKDAWAVRLGAYPPSEPSGQLAAADR